MAGFRSLKLAAAGFVLLVACAAQSTQPPNSAPVLSEPTADSYAIYSVLLAGQQPRNGQHIAIADTTIGGDEIKSEPDEAISSPPGSANSFDAAVHDFQARREHRVQLQPPLHLNQPYRLLTEDEVHQFTQHSGNMAGLRPDATITRFSEAYFNSTQTAALVYMDKICSSPCGDGQWFFLEKQNGHWTRHASSIADRADTYAIYSLLLRDEPYPGLPQQQGAIAIADTTVNITDMNPSIAPDSQLKPPPNNPDAFEEAVEDFRVRRYDRMQLTHEFQLDQDYSLLSSSDVQAYKSAQTGYPAVNFFSEVYFDSKQTVALVYRSVFCGHLCANGSWIYLEKRGKDWVRRSGLNI